MEAADKTNWDMATLGNNREKKSKLLIRTFAYHTTCY
jgi:hypothetical protein